MPETKRTISNPLTDADHKRIRNNRERLRKLKELMDRMERCGIECTENRELADRFDTFLASIETEFFNVAVPE